MPDWCLFKLGLGQGYLGNHTIDSGLFVLLRLWRLCVSFNGIHQFSLLLNNYCFTNQKRLQHLDLLFSWPKKVMFSDAGIFIVSCLFCFVLCCSFILFTTSSSSYINLNRKKLRKKKIKYYVKNQEQNPILINLTSKTCAVKKNKHFHTKISSLWFKEKEKKKLSEWQTIDFYTFDAGTLWLLVFTLPLIFFSLKNSDYSKYETHKSTTVQTFSFTLSGGGRDVGRFRWY